jgi:hypothetical protein
MHVFSEISIITVRNREVDGQDLDRKVLSTPRLLQRSYTKNAALGLGTL